MRTLVSVVLLVLGGLLVLLGSAVAVVAGPDDTASLPADDVPAASGVAITAFDLVPVQDLTLHVTATSAGGPVFVGAAHPVDARDYVSGVAATWVQGVDRSGALTGEAVEGELDAPEVDPTTAGFWSASASGEGSRSVDVRLTDEPVTFVVAPVGGPAATTLAFGVVVPHAFVAGLATAGAGALLVVLAVVLRRRRRRGDDGAVGATLGGTPPEQEPVPAPAGRGVTERRAVVLGAGLTIALTACAPLPSAVEYPDEPTRLAADEAELDAALASYGERRTAASALGAQHDPTAWATADTDGLLALMEFQTRIAAAGGDPVTASSTSYTVLDAAVPEFTSYPMWFVALVEQTVDGTTSELPQLRVLERDRAAAPWRSSLALEVPVDSVDLPGPGAASGATAEQVAAGLAALELVRSHIETGAEVAVELGELQEFREVWLGDDLDGRLRLGTSEVKPFHASEDPVAPGGPVQVVPVEGGVLVTAALSYYFNRTMEPGYVLSLDDAAIATVTDQTGERDSLRTFGLIQTAILVPDGGTPRVVAGTWSLLAPGA